MDVFSPALEIRNAGNLRDCISPTPRNWRELEHPVDVFSPAPDIRNLRQTLETQERPGDVFSPR